MVDLRVRNSPFTSTSIFLERSPFATAVVTSAMFRTCEVRLPAIEFTLSVRSFHTPATPFTLAWPPSFPSVPTSLATRVTSAAKSPSWSTMRLMILAFLRNSPSSGRPSISSAIVLERSPCATAPITRAASLVGCTRSSISELMLSTFCAQKPRAFCSEARRLSLPSLPTICESLASSSAIATFCSTRSLNTSATRENAALPWCGSLAEASPLRSATRAP